MTGRRWTHGCSGSASSAHFGWVLAVGYLAVVARAARAPRAEWLFIGLAAFFFLLGHPAPFGTIAFGSLFIAAVIHERQASTRP